MSEASERDLKEFSLFAEFGDADREALLELLEPKRLPKGRTLFRAGSEADGMVLVLSGVLELKSPYAADSGAARAGTALGALSLVVVGPREATAKSHEACELLLLPRTAFRRLVDDHPRTACRLVEAILSEFSASVRDGLPDLCGG